MDQMLDAGFWILDFKRKLSLFFQHPASSIQYLANCGINDRLYAVVIFGSGLSVLCFYIKFFEHAINKSDEPVALSLCCIRNTVASNPGFGTD